jgi:hypothetical protein
MAKKMSPEQRKAKLAELQALNEQIAKLNAPEVQEPSFLEKAIHAYEVPGSKVRGTIAQAAEPFVGKPLVTKEELQANEVPGMYDIAKRADIDLLGASGGLVRNLAKLTGQEEPARKYVGTLLDVGTDPLSMSGATELLAPISKGGKAAVNFLNLLLNPAGEAISAAGKGISKAGSAAYKSAFKKINEAIAEKTGKGISGINLGDLLEKERVAGSYEQVVPRIEELAAPVGEEIGRFRQYAANRGVMVKPTEFATLEKEIADLRQVGTPEFSKKADYLQSELDALREVAPKYPSEVSQTQSTLRSYLPKNAWAMSTEDALKTRGIKGQMAALANAEEQAMMSKLRPEEVADFIANKEKYGLLQETQDVLKEAKKEANRTGADLSAFDTTMAAFGLMQGDPRVLAAAAAKKARDIARLSSTRTKGGLLLKDIGTTMQNASSKIPPQLWLEMLRNKQGEEQ